MDSGKADQKLNKRMVVVKEELDQDQKNEDCCGDTDDHHDKKMMGCFEENDNNNNSSRKKKGVVLGSSSGGGGGKNNLMSRCCQAEKCTADLSDAKQYHRRHKVCEYHAKAQVVLVAGLRQRFCQQCSRFHELSEFDETRRSCRRRLAGHNERRRKSSTETHAEGSGRKSTGGTHQLKDMVCGQGDDRGRIQIAVQENATYKHFQIR